MMNGERNFLAGFVLLMLAFALGVNNEYLLHIAVLILLYAILATSLNLIVGYVGEFPLGHVAFFGIGAYTLALGATKLGLAPGLLLPLAGVVSAVAGLVIGGVTLRLKGPFFVIVTLAFAEVLRLVANNWIDLTNGPMGISGVPHPAFLDAAGWLAGKRGYAALGVALAAVTLFIAYRLVHSNAGRAAITLRENRYVAVSIGIDPVRYALFVFTVAAFLAGLAGAYYAAYISYVGPEVFGFPFTVSMIIMVLLGGKGTLSGPLIGAVVVTLLEEYLREFKELRLSLFGLIVMGVVLFSPNGIMGYARRLAPRRAPAAEKRHA
ncbi:branched-chain amino acid ABC transporter permease [Bordetella genomosp. 9]|uniref:branched-chain amino acid ABC transporter permease n=1 Tax=Bordetella genomosp. 9 TaxID=1416803 RepID=UPI001E50666A|nr:branched-chain amino acid ABC transporter permease [Bordetella genomosp. 9]